MNKRAPRRSNEEWHQIILAARASGLSDFEYCRDNSIPSSSFYRALARLRQQACELPARFERSECKQEVVPINISELPSLGLAPAPHAYSVSHGAIFRSPPLIMTLTHHVYKHFRICLFFFPGAWPRQPSSERRGTRLFIMGLPLFLSGVK